MTVHETQCPVSRPSRSGTSGGSGSGRDGGSLGRVCDCTFYFLLEKFGD